MTRLGSALGGRRGGFPIQLVEDGGVDGAGGAEGHLQHVFYRERGAHAAHNDGGPGGREGGGDWTLKRVQSL